MDRLVSSSDLRRCVLADPEALACVIGCFSRHAQGRATAGRELGLALGPGARLHAGAAMVDGLYSLAVRVGAEVADAPAAEDALLLLSPETGEPQAVLMDDGYLAELGATLAGAAAARFLAPDPLRTVAVLGPGTRALAALEALALVRDFEEVLLAGSARAADALAAETESPVRAVTRREEAVSAAGLVLVVGRGSEHPEDGPLLEPSWIRPGQHVWSLGPDAPLRSPEELGGFDLVACDLVEGSPLRGAPAGELVSLGRLTTGQHPGRRDAEQRTLFQGGPSPMLDTALGFLAWRKSQKYKLGSALGS